MKTPIITLVLFSAISLTAQQQPKKPVAAAAPVKLTTTADTLQYSLGAYLGQYIASNGFSITNADLFIAGMNDAMGNKALLVNSETISKKINEYQGQMAVERNTQIEKQLFESIRGKPGYGMLPSGVCYTIVKAGTGVRPSLTDTVQLQVKGYLPEGKLFEDTYVKNAPYKVTPAGLIPGLSEIVQIMPAGSLWKIFIPSALAFGDKGVQGLVPTHSAVVFEVELLGVKK